MAGNTIPDYPSVGTITGSETIPIWQGAQKAVSLAALAVTMSNLGGGMTTVAPYYSTRAAGVAGTSVGGIFTSDEVGQMAIYKHTSTTPFYTELQRIAAQASIDLLNSSRTADEARISVLEHAGSVSLTASEAISAHAYVHINGTNVRNACANDPTLWANGFVIAGIANGASGLAFNFGLNPVVVSSGAAEVWLSDTVPGGVQTSPPSTSGHIVQPLGPAITGVGILFFPQARIQL